MADVSKEDIRHLVRDKYAGDESADLSTDVERLTAGEPLAYVIGWIPFLGLRINLNSHPLIPRPETEHWTQALIDRLHLVTTVTKWRHGDEGLRVLDLCAGSGAIGLAVLAQCPQARVTFADIVPEHAALIRENIASNALDASRADIRTGDLFAPLAGERYDVIATNPPYIPQGRTLGKSVAAHEPHEALFAGIDGLAIIERIAREARGYLNPGGELWMECDTSNIEKARELSLTGGAAAAEIRTDQYGRPRYVVAYFP